MEAHSRLRERSNGVAKAQLSGGLRGSQEEWRAEFGVISDSGHTYTASCSKSEDGKRERKACSGKPRAENGWEEVGAGARKAGGKGRKQGRVVPLTDDDGHRNAWHSDSWATSGGRAKPRWATAAGAGAGAGAAAPSLTSRTEFPVVSSSFAVLQEEPSLNTAETSRPWRVDKCGPPIGSQQQQGRGRFSIVSGTVSSVRGKNAAVLEGSNMTVCSQNGKGGGPRGESDGLGTVDALVCPEEVKRRNSKKKLKNKVSDDMEPKDAVQKKAVEDFLLEMLPENSNLGVDIVRDVLSLCEADVPKAVETLLNKACSCGSSGEAEPRTAEPEATSSAEPLQALLSAFSNLDPEVVVKAYQEREGDLELTADALLQADCLEDLASTPIGPLFDAAVADPEHSEGHSSVRVVMSWLQGTFPCIDAAVLLEVLQVNDFSPSKTVDFLVEGATGASEGSSLAAASLSTSVMQTLFKAKVREEQVSPATCGDAVRGNSIGASDTWQLVQQKSPRDKCGRRIEEEEGFDEYQASRKLATQEWQKMNEFFTEAACAYSRGERAYASILSAKGKEHQKRAREASDEASSHLFSVKNKHWVNNITIDLHAQHVKEAMSLLKLHLKSLAPLSSVQTLTVITGHGNGHGNGHAKIRPAVVRYLEKKGILWKDENSGCLVIDMENVSLEKLAS